MPNLKTITIGNESFQGSPDVECELKLSSICYIVLLHIELEKLESLIIGSNSFEWVKELKMVNLTHLKKLLFKVGSFGSSLDGSFEMRYCGNAVKELLNDKPSVGNNCANQIGIFFKNESFMHWNEFILSNCSIKRIKVGVDCFMRCEYAVFNGRLVIESND